MEVLINTYPIFEDNQVLTSGQLNQLHNYLDQQNRLTRSSLIGVGIACGLDIEVIAGNEPNVIINEGIGITSDGYLIKFCPPSGLCTTVQYQNYTLPEGIVYTPFQDEEFKQNVDLYELLTSDAQIDEDEEVSPLTAIPEGLQNKVVILFLECLDNDLKSCLGKSCDELGVDRIFNLRKLLINADDLLRINGSPNTNEPEDASLTKDDLKDLSLPRVIFDQVDTANYFSLAFKYIDFINGPLKDELKKTYEVYEPILRDCYGGNPFDSAPIEDTFNRLKAYFEGDTTSLPWWGVQYVYDFVKDLLLAYQEFKDCAYDLMSQCCHNMSGFPKHLMLGKLFDVQRDPCQTDLFRHGFTQPSIYNHQSDLLAKTRSLHKRLILMLENFSFDRIDFLNAEEIALKVTPSCEKKPVLAKRSIPFYYDSKSDSRFDKLKNLELEWNFSRKQRQCQLLDKELNTLNRSYDNNTMIPEAKTPLTTPLRFDIDQLNFLRLEGLHGKDIRQTLLGLSELRERANLNFDVRAVYFGDIPLKRKERSVLPDCLYQDLQVDYAVWRGKLVYLLGSFSRLITGSRFLQRKDTSENISNYMSVKDTSELYRDLNNIDNLNRSLTNNNWMKVVDEVHYKTKADNKSEWIKREKEMASGPTIGTNRSNVDDLHAQITDCLIEIRNSTPENILKFEMATWLNAYRCPLDLFIEYIKLKTAQVPNDTNITQVNVAIRLIAALQELLRNIFIYPYIDIRIIHNTLVNRIKVYHEQHNFGEFIKNHPGLEHKAGVEQGQTLVLLYQGSYSEKSQEKNKEIFTNWVKETKNTAIDIDDFIELNENGTGKILADFTLPYKCCDPCMDVGSVENHLDPLALPICEIVPTTIDNEKSLITYDVLEERVLHSMYEPDRYRLKLVGSAGAYGKASWGSRKFPFDDTIDVQTFAYIVTEEEVSKASVGNKSAYLIDSFTYEIEKLLVTKIEEVRDGKIVVVEESEFKTIDSAEITVIIPIIPSEESAIGIKGRIFRKEGAKRIIPIPNARVWTKLGEKEITSTTDDKGMYSLTDPALVNKTYELRVIANGYDKRNIPGVTIKNGMVTQNIELFPEVKLKDSLKDLLTKIDFEENSKEAVLLAEEYDNSARLYREVIANAITREKENVKTLIKTEKVISKFNDEAVMSSEELNKAYKENRDILLKELAETTNKTTKANRVDALKVLTNSYMDRLVINEGKDIDTESIKTLKESSTQIKKAGVNMSTEMKEWSKSKTRVLGKEIVGNITKNFK